jgi:dTDP-4-amino-4,6-dideoxygalactose transaminase
MAILAINGGKPIRKRPFPSWPVWDEREEKMLLDVLHSGVWGIGGKRVEELQETFARLHNARHGVAVFNATAALEVALKAARIGMGDEVIVPPYTFVATVTAVLCVNAIPVFADIDLRNFCLDPKSVEAAITEKTRAILPVHLGGHPADLDGIMELAKKHDLVVIEDCAQAIWAEWRGRKVGTIGHLGCFSFQASKNISTGEGGMILTNDPELAERCWSYRNCGRRPDGEWYEHPRLGWNYRMTEFQAGVALAQIQRLEEQSLRRQENARYLSQRLQEIEGIAPLPVDERVTRHGYHLYIFMYTPAAFGGLSRDRFVSALNAEGIPSLKGYVPLYKEGYLEEAKEFTLRYPDYLNRNYSRLSLPATEKASAYGVWLPQEVLLGTQEDMDTIVAAVRKVQEHASEIA